MSTPPAEPAGHRDAVFGLARRAGSTLLVCNQRLREGTPRGCWDLPGGTLHRGEDLPTALRREWQEETGLAAEVGALRLVVDGRKERPAGPVLYTWRAFFFDVETVGTAAAGAGIDDVAWVPDEDVPARLDAPYHEALRAHLQGAPGLHAAVRWIEPAPDGADPDASALRHLLIVAAAASVGAREDLASELRRAQAAGVAPARLLETLLQIVPYAGYPRAITALGIGRAVLGTLRAAADLPREDAYARGHALFSRVYGETSDAVLAGLEARDPLLARWTLEHAYGRVLAREGALTLLERELLAVSILTAMGGLEAPLLGHMRAVLRLGGTADDVRRAVQVVPSSFGEERRDSAQRLLTRLQR
jgi:4-carboxymuconolactone decarboxylase